MLRVLNVAEKNDAAKGIADILSRGQYRLRPGRAKYNKLYEFNYPVFGQNAQMVVTSVSGHLFNYDFTGQYRGNWEATPPLALFEAPIEKKCHDDNGQILVSQLEQEAGNAQHLIIWTDCDREGENIGYEIIDVCLRRNRNLRVHRARFSEITHRSITNALQNLIQPDKRISDAVDCRQELDLRIGAAFTRFQTLRLRQTIPQLRDLLISYGSCQFPTLGFVVERYKARLNFIQEPFWKLVVKHTKAVEPDENAASETDQKRIPKKSEGKGRLTTEFSWRRLRLFDRDVCEAYLQKCMEKNLAVVEKVTTKPKSRWRPTALDTVELEKIASRKLRLTAKRTMETAERLYTRGFISYPRTETNIFPADIDLQALVEVFTTDHQYGQFAQDVLQRGVNPRNGTKTDQAHPPIHPTKYATPMELQGDEKSVYEFVVRRFLACVSRDARGFETVVDVDVNGEKFYASGLIITDRGYLEIYHPYEQWSDKTIPRYEDGETFTPDSIAINEGITSPPSLLTEADLIALMEKHGIGTDATHAEHIEKIKARCYAALNPERRFIPGYLGLGLVDGYDSMGYPMSKPRLRAELETGLKEICEGRKTRDEVLRVQVAKYKEIFQRATAEAQRLDRAIADYFGQNNGQPPPPPGPPGGGGGGPGNGPRRDDHGNGPPRNGPPGNRPPGNRPPRNDPPGTDPPRTDPFGNGPIRQPPNDSPPPTDENRDVNPEVLCQCGEVAQRLTCRKPGPNQGRPFDRCPNNACKFFAWADGQIQPSRPIAPVHPQQRPPPSTAATNDWDGGSASITCNCGLEARNFTVKKEGPNQGRQFYTCPQKQTGGCNFFQWADGPPANNNGPGNGINSGFRQQPIDRSPPTRPKKSQKSKSATEQPRSGASYAQMFPDPVFASGGATSGKKRGIGRGSGNENNKKPRKKPMANNQKGGGKKCGYCHEPGHTIRTCPNKHAD